MDELNKLGEFIILNKMQPRVTVVSKPTTSTSMFQINDENTSDELKNEFKWTIDQTKLLLDLYKIYKNKVGTMELRSLKQMWRKIAEELKKHLNINVTDQNCQNRWKVIERNYKKYIDNQKATRRGKKYFDYVQEMEDIVGHRKSIHSELLLTNEDINIVDMTNVVEACQEEEESKDVNSENYKASNSLKIKSRVKRKSVLELMRQDRQKYYNERLQLEREKLQILKKKNDLIQERNNILKEKNDL